MFIYMHEYVHLSENFYPDIPFTRKTDLTNLIELYLWYYCIKQLF